MVKYIIYIFLVVATISCTKKAEFIRLKLLERKVSIINDYYSWGYEENVL